MGKIVLVARLAARGIRHKAQAVLLLLAITAAQVQADTRTLTHLGGVTEYSGPYPVASAILRARGLTSPGLVAAVLVAENLALAVALASTLVPAVKAARSSTVSALADSPRPPRRRAALIALSARLPVPMLLGIRMAVGRLRRAPSETRGAAPSGPAGVAAT